MTKRLFTSAVLTTVALSAAQAFALDPCKVESYRKGDQQRVAIRVGSSQKADKYEQFDNAVNYLVQLDGKACDVDWINDAGKLLLMTDAPHGEPGGSNERARKTVADKVAEAKAKAKASPSSCEAKLAIAQERIQSLDASIYNSMEKRSQFIQELKTAIDNAGKAAH